MNRASPVQLRKSLELAHAFAKDGVNFVCIPVVDEADHANLAGQAQERLERIAVIVESKERMV
jgi:hypothetical protein